ncbi:MAG: heme-binding domain-containing protein [Sulfuricurvum sp.]|uniref:heme-binding domain-containing protein n=1 Tax=Sulfuricurvum sp. TaxID=2025608 RepID=UPI0026101F25|nr:heme-binding domain-containing protein [Sulfuricurvum sp.]MDD2828737.1 heme-binding domain-containing protein [Sulfuricurvum sp.]MDD4949315.1 heme-binding domain-containing protein [Sulfuricurvum sp.]
MNLKVLSIAVVVTAVAIQFIPYGKEHTNPPVVSSPLWDSPRTQELFNRACADCHSNQTKYPWYSNIAPISWLVMHDIEEGREKLNVSMLGVQKKNKVKDAADEVKEGEMPIPPYFIAHPEARLSDTEKQELISGLEKTFGKEEK